MPWELWAFFLAVVAIFWVGITQINASVDDRDKCRPVCAPYDVRTRYDSKCVCDLTHEVRDFTPPLHQER